MREMPANKLDPRIKNVWRISDSIWITLTFLVVLVCMVIWHVSAPSGWSLFFLLLTLALYVACMVLFLVGLTPLRYARWRYELTSDYLDISHGIFWRKRIIVPFIRVQNTDTSQGPIMRAFGLSSVTVATAAGLHEIPGLPNEEADILRDKAAELARIAREDV